MKRIITFCGASGTGKTTLLNYLKENYKIECKELSARPFLPKGESYDISMNDDIQYNIMFNNSITLLKELTDYKGPICYTRGPIDVLAYSKSLEKGIACQEQQLELIKYLYEEKGVTLFYLPIEFDMEDKEDTLRGTNQKIRNLTDKYIQDIIKKLEIPHTKIVGSIEERQKYLDIIMNIYGIEKKYPS